MTFSFYFEMHISCTCKPFVYSIIMWTPKQIYKEGQAWTAGKCVFLAQSSLLAGVLIFCKYWMGTFKTLLFKDGTVSLWKFRNKNVLLILIRLNLIKNHPWAFVLYVTDDSLSVGWIRNMNQCCGKCIQAIKRCPSSHKQTVELCRAPANLMTDFPGTAESSGCRVCLDANAAWHLHPCLSNPCYPEQATATAN